MTISKKILDELLEGVKNPEDLLGQAGLMKDLKIGLMERMLGAEMSEHLGYEPNGEPAASQGNRRNGTSRKVVKGTDGDMGLDIPRDSPSHTCKHVLPGNGWQFQPRTGEERSDPN